MSRIFSEQTESCISPTCSFVPVALVPSILRSYIRTELSEQPTARWYGTGGQIATEVAARRQLIKISYKIKQQQSHRAFSRDDTILKNALFNEKKAFLRRPNAVSTTMRGERWCSWIFQISSYQQVPLTVS